MSKIDELISELCPEGVPYFSVQELFDIRNGYTPSKNVEDYWSNGEIPWFRMEDIRENGRILSDSKLKVSISALKSGKLFPANSLLFATSATIGEHALITVPHLSNQRFTSLTVKPKFESDLLVKFAFYFGFVLSEWCKQNTSMSSFASVDMARFREFKFPIPPLPVQLEIVETLDAYAELEAELEAELKLRRRQYKYFRDQMFSFPKHRVSWVPMGSIGEFTRGKGMPKEQLTLFGVPAIHYGQLYTDFEVWTQQTKSFIANELVHSTGEALPGDLLMPMSDVTPVNVGKAVAWLGDQPVRVGGDVLVFRHNIDPKFLAFYCESDMFQRQKLPMVTGATVRHISAKSLSKILVPVPSIDIQVEIATALTSMHSMIHSLEIGLPAELIARRKQYEFYRDKLLTFKELAA